MTFVEFLILTLAVFRLARLVIEDTITEPLRSAVLSHWPGQDVEYEAGDKVRGGVFQIDGKLYAQEPTATGNKIAKLLGCYACSGFWLALAVSVGWYFSPSVTFWVMLPFALSGAVWVIAVVQNWFDAPHE